jgi:uncharacterized membrane protein YdjX (TVP38/TMEM64 family)
VLEAVRNPVAYFLAMIVVFSAASLPPTPPTLMAAKANPAWLLAVLGAAAAGIAAVVDYHLVRRVFRIGALERARRHPLFERAERWAKVAPFFTVVLFAALPLPFMIPRVLVPVTGYPLHRYAAAVAVGRLPRVFVLAAFGQVFDVPSWILEALFAGGVALAGLGALFRRMGWRVPGLAGVSGTIAADRPDEPPPAAAGAGQGTADPCSRPRP